MTTNSTTLPTATANTIRDIKPPYPIASEWAWAWWLGALLAAVILAFILWRWLRKKKVVPTVPPIPAHIRAKRKLADALAIINDPKPFCVLVSDTVRFYLEERFEIRAPEQTTEEFLRELRRTDLLLPDQKESLGNFLVSCDLVKFAKYEPGMNELQDLHHSALRLVEETEPAAEASGAPPPLNPPAK